MKKILASVTVVATLFATSLSAIDLGLFKISPEIGGSVGYKKTDLTLKDVVKANGDVANLIGKDNLVYGAYGRLWLGVFGVMIAPQVKWEQLPLDFGMDEKSKINNLQYGGIFGFEIPMINLTPYIGASYSTFNKDLDNTWALNFGAKIDIPFTFLTLGIDGSWQKPKIQSSNGSSMELLTVSATLGLAF